eukprot:jgi/Chrzof1/13751/Cz08g10210.t1
MLHITWHIHRYLTSPFDLYAACIRTDIVKDLSTQELLPWRKDGDTWEDESDDDEDGDVADAVDLGDDAPHDNEEGPTYTLQQVYNSMFASGYATET